MKDRRDERPAGDVHGEAASRGRNRLLVAACAILVVAVAILLCLRPKGGHDLFWQLRAGADILTSGSVPREDVYSWSARGTRWDVPEWGAFALLALAYRAAGGFAGTWLMLVAMASATALIVLAALLRQARPPTALALALAMLLAMSVFLQQRPYLFTFLFLAIGVAIMQSPRRAQIWWLVPISVAWANLHQGVVVMAAIVGAAAAGDLAQGWYVRRRERARGRGASTDPVDAADLLNRGRRRVLVAFLCLGAAMASPYGWSIYRNIYVTLRDPDAMRLVREWSPVTMMPADKVWAFYLLAAIVVASLLLSRRRVGWGDALPLAGLLGQSFLHVRHVPLFAIAGVLISATHVESALDRLAPRGILRTLAGEGRHGRLVGAGFVVILLAAVASAGVVELGKAIGPKGWTLEGVGEASVRLGSFPEDACAFVEAQGFPPNLRIYNDYDMGGFLIWRLPSQPVFMDGRNDVYTGPVLEDFVALRNARGPGEVREILDRRDFECVITTAGSEIRAFALDADQWIPVYAEPKGPLPHGRGRCWILLRNRPEFRDLIMRCRRACPALNSPLR